MDFRKAVLAGLTVLALVLAGCSGEGAVEATPTPTVADPTQESKTGVIRGVVTDTEGLPIVAAQVGLVETGDTTQTDDAGAFAFGDLEAGEYRLVVTRLGYEEHARRAAVVAGETTEITITLSPLVVTPDPYYDIYPATALITFGQALVDNRVPLEYHPCQACDHFVHITPEPAAGLVEATFTNGIQAPMDDIWFQVNRNWTNGTGAMPISDGEIVVSGYLSDRESTDIDEDDLEEVADNGVTELWIHIASGFFVPSVNKRVDLFLTLGYHDDELPEGFTALPPE